MIRNLLSIFLLCLLFGCKSTNPTEIEIYSNDFEAGNLTHITNGAIELYNGSHVLGRYNNQSFNLILNDLPKHGLVEVSFDLYIHDSWDGNKSGDSGRNGPDIWKFMVDGNEYINTTFSNADCGSVTFCLPQSYPQNYLNNNNNPKTGAYNKDLPGVCQYAGQPGWTSQYKISKTIRHSGSTISIQCLDQLIQTNAVDPKCDESWSIDNLKVKLITL